HTSGGRCRLGYSRRSIEYGMRLQARGALLVGSISMIDLACPNCGRAGTIPREKINTRLVCKKCHVTFHMNTAGRTLLGEPHQEVAKPEVTHHDGPQLPSFENLGSLKDTLPTVSLKALLIGIAVIVVGGGLFMFMMKPPESLGDRAKMTA